MIIKYEKLTSKLINEETGIEKEAVEKKEDATHEHKCYHDELNEYGTIAKPCIRKELKK